MNALWSQKRQMLATAFGYPSLFPAMASGYKSLYLDREDLDQEQVRLSTFVCWPKWTPKSITRESMAKTGLHFTGDGDVVKCFSCKVVLENWKEGDDPLDRHRRQSPHCDFLRQILCNYDDLVVDGERAAAECDNDEDYGNDEIDGAVPQSHQDNNVRGLEPLDSLHSMGNSCSALPEKTKSNSSGNHTLKLENEKLRNAVMCRKCKRERIQTLFLPCRHLVTCEECAEKMENCIQCNQLILGTVRTFMT